mgnify:CR=1 FL=1
MKTLNETELKQRKEDLSNFVEEYIELCKKYRFILSACEGDEWPVPLTNDYFDKFDSLKRETEFRLREMDMTKQEVTR